MPAFQFPDPLVQTTVKNPITGSTYQWKADPGKWVMTVSIREIGDIIWEGDAPPNPIGDYKLWYSTDTLELYFYYCDANGVCAWLPTSVPIQVLEDLNAFAAQAEVDIDQLQYKQQLLQNALDQIYLDQQQGSYVKKAGDTMTGELIIDDAKLTLKNSPLDLICEAESLKDVNGDPILDGNGNEQWDPNAERFAMIESLPPRLFKSDGTYGGDTKTTFGIKVELDDGNTFKNQFKVGNRNGDAVTIAGGTGPAVTFGSGFPGNQDKVAPGDEGKVRIKGIPTPDFETADDDIAVNKRYVDERDNLLRQDIIELEEEIDAIAPSLEYGNWVFEQPSSNARPPAKGTFYLLDELGQLTTEYKDTKIIVINNYEYDDPTDSDPVDIHTWADADPGELIQLFDAADPDFMLGKIDTVTPDTDGSLEFVRITIDLIQSSGVPNDNADPITGLYLTRVNIFKEPSGGTASDFVMKTGDEMSGKLEFINKDETGGKYNLVDSTSHLKFTTGNGSGDERSASIYQPGYLVALNTDCNLNVNGDVASSNGTFVGYSTNDTTITYWKPRVSFSADDTGGFYYGSNSTNNRRVYIDSSYNYLNHGGHTSARWNGSGINLYYRGSNRIQVTSTGTQFYNPVFLDHNSTRLSLKKDLTASNNNGDSSYGTSGQVLTSNGSNKPPYWAAASGKVDITCSSSGKTKGDMWYCASDGVLYLKVS